MMVTFISQCEKNSLKKTRRVLDAFANRIGDNTWQTVITEDGLNTVKKMLRQSASKNTAVSCHWIRSRSRSQFLWVVGNKNKFDAQGVVPVNTTTKELIMDKIEQNHNEILANTNSQPLDQHLFAVAYVAYCFVKQLTNNEKLASASFIAGCYHDLGKLDPEFQTWLLKLKKIKKLNNEELPDDGVHIEKGDFSFEKHPRHNEISLLLYSLLNDQSDKYINRKQSDYVTHAIYWHHAKPIRKINYKTQADIYKKTDSSLKDEQMSSFLNRALSLLKNVNHLAENYSDNTEPKLPRRNNKADEDDIFDLKNQQLPIYKEYSDHNDDVDGYMAEVKQNANKNIVRSALITADRIVSSLTVSELDSYIKNQGLDTLVTERLTRKNDLQIAILSCLNGFEAKFPDSQRNIAQSKAALKLADAEHVAVLNGPAGCGKTKIALEWAAKTNANKIIWVCPRVQVCLGLYEDLSQQDYVPNSQIEIYTGEYKKIKTDGIEKETNETEAFSGDIVITTIDQAVNAVITHTQVTALIDIMNSHVVFDEFHELITAPAFNLLFAELVENKKQQGNNANTLLVSATPNYFFIDEMLKIDSDDVIGIASFNESKYRIEFDIYDDSDGGSYPLTKKVDKENTFVISNTAKDAQIGFIKNISQENAILIHSKFKKDDKLTLFKKVFDNFKEGGKRQFSVLRSGPIVQASLNISCDNMVTEFTQAENWLQRIGRLDRFGENKAINEYTTVVAKSIDSGKQQSNCAKFLNHQHAFLSAKAWYQFLRNNLDDNIVNINDLYCLYEDFYNDGKSLKEIEEDLLCALKKSVKLLNENVVDPVSFPIKKKPKDGVVKIKKHSLRGDNRFVQMAVCNVDTQGELTFLNEYAYAEDTDHSQVDIGLATSVELIKGYGNSSEDLLSHMFKKHHNIKPGFKKPHKDYLLLNDARSPETPIYLSYTPEDLTAIGGDDEAHQSAIYYAVCDKQPIGSISINKLSNKGE